MTELATEVERRAPDGEDGSWCNADPLPRPALSSTAFWLASGALGCLAATLLVGVALALATADSLAPAAAATWPRVQPLHTLFAFGTVLFGIAALLELEARRTANEARSRWRATLPAWILGLFFSLAAYSIASGRGSGREYLGWAPELTPLLLVALVALVARLAPSFRGLVHRSPEGAWLVALGLVCLPLALAEGYLDLLLPLDFGTGLSYEWHALDLLFAGWNAALYGFGVFASGSAKPLRSRVLYALAAFCFVSTFAHHHYLSPQPTLLKQIAVVASLLGAVSFVRHARAFAGGGDAPGHAAAPFLRAVEAWTLVAIGSGIALAVPQVNLVLHGTYAIVAHSMVAMIGVNVLLVVGCLVAHLAPAAEPARFARPLRAVNLLLAALGLDLAAAGTVEGVLRFEHPWVAYRPLVARLLAPLPYLGAGLALAMGLLVWRVARHLRAARKQGEERAKIPVRATR